MKETHTFICTNTHKYTYTDDTHIHRNTGLHRHTEVHAQTHVQTDTHRYRHAQTHICTKYNSTMDPTENTNGHTDYLQNILSRGKFTGP